MKVTWDGDLHSAEIHELVDGTDVVKYVKNYDNGQATQSDW
jgi:hypothetical protein